MQQVAQMLFDELESQLVRGYSVTKRGRDRGEMDEAYEYMQVGDLLEVQVREPIFPTVNPKRAFRHEYDVVVELGGPVFRQSDGDTIRSLTREEWVRKAAPVVLKCLQRELNHVGSEWWHGSVVPQYEAEVARITERLRNEYKWPIFLPPGRPGRIPATR